MSSTGSILKGRQWRNATIRPTPVTFSGRGSERILKIGHYLVKLWTRVWCLVFYWTTVYILTLLRRRIVLYSRFKRSLLSNVQILYIGNLEAKILWLKNYERVQEIQQQIFWRPITDVEPRAFIPEVALKAAY